MVGREGGVELRQPIDGFTERARRLANVGEQDHRDAVGGRHEEQPTNECRRFPRIGQVAQIEARQPKQRVHMVGIKCQRFAEHLGGRRMALEVLGNAPAQSQEGGVPKAKFMRLVEQPLGLVGISALHETLDEGGANGAFHRVLLQQVQQQRFCRGNPSGTPLGLGQQQRGRRGSLFEQPLGDLLRATGAARTVLSLARKKAERHVGRIGLFERLGHDRPEAQPGSLGGHLARKPRVEPPVLGGHPEADQPVPQLPFPQRGDREAKPGRDGERLGRNPLLPLLDGVIGIRHLRPASSHFCNRAPVASINASTL